MRSAVFAAVVSGTAAHIDWRDTGCIGDVVNQGHLGTADVTPSVEAVQCAVLDETGKALKLSTQQVLDCAINLGEFGSAFEYIRHEGLETAAAYPSAPAKDSESNNAHVGRKQCIYEESLVVVRVGDIGGSAVGDANETDLEAATHIAPVAVAFTVGTELELYTGGVLSDCGVGGSHVMEVVGFSDHDPDTNNTACKSCGVWMRFSNHRTWMNTLTCQCEFATNCMTLFLSRVFDLNCRLDCEEQLGQRMGHQRLRSHRQRRWIVRPRQANLLVPEERDHCRIARKVTPQGHLGVLRALCKTSWSPHCALVAYKAGGLRQRKCQPHNRRCGFQRSAIVTE